MSTRIDDAQAFVDRLFELAQRYPGQPVAVIDQGELMVGVMSLVNPTETDWFYKPVNVENLPLEEETESADHSN